MSALLRWRPAVVLGLLLVAVEAAARVGGGEGFGTGRGGGGGGGGGYGGGAAVDGDLVYLLIHLLVRYPQVGVPVLVIVVVLWTLSQRSGGGTWVVEGHAPDHRPVRRPSVVRSAWKRLAEEDPGLSEPVLHDYVQLVFRRAYEAVGTGNWDPLAPFVGEAVRRDLEAGNRGVSAVRDVVVASSTVVAVRRVAGHDELDLDFASSRVETFAGEERRVYAEERWTFRRRVGARSLPPEPALRLGCPSCGAAPRTDAMGRCTHCGTPITAGQLQWQATAVEVRLRRPIEAPEVGYFQGGDEPSFHVPTVQDPDYAAQLRAFRGRHPHLDPKDFDRRVRDVFLSLQAAWDAGRWEDARPYCTDAAWNRLRFWMERYAHAGLRNRVQDVRILKTSVVKITVDAWYEAVTVRIWASAKDWVEDASERVVGGNARMDRRFSEYWTFLRAVGSGDTVHDARNCPSCGAPLDRINAAGVCGYCDSVITTGRFDWVLSRIDQPEVYRG